MYNIIFTTYPVVWYALFDFEFPKHVLFMNPSLYKPGIKNEFFTKKIFWRWILYGSIQACVLLFMLIDTFEIGAVS